MTRTDEQIKNDVIDQLVWDRRVDASDVQVEVSEGNVTLTGTVPSYGAWSAARSAAWEIRGVLGVTNELDVRFPPTLKVPTDAEIHRKVELGLSWSPDIDPRYIDVSASEGVVNMKGTVDAYWKKQTAQKIASSVSGVVGVENKFTVVPVDKVADEEIKQNLETALERIAYLDEEDVNVRVENGEVAFTGTVSTGYAREQARNVAV